MRAISVSINANVKLGPTFRKVWKTKATAKFSHDFSHFASTERKSKSTSDNTQENEQLFLAFAILHLIDSLAILRVARSSIIFHSDSSVSFAVDSNQLLYPANHCFSADSIHISNKYWLRLKIKCSNSFCVQNARKSEEMLRFPRWFIWRWNWSRTDPYVNGAQRRKGKLPILFRHFISFVRLCNIHFSVCISVSLSSSRVPAVFRAAGEIELFSNRWIMTLSGEWHLTWRTMSIFYDVFPQPLNASHLRFSVHRYMEGDGRKLEVTGENTSSIFLMISNHFNFT